MIEQSVLIATQTLRSDYNGLLSHFTEEIAPNGLKRVGVRRFTSEITPKGLFKALSEILTTCMLTVYPDSDEFMFESLRIDDHDVNSVQKVLSEMNTQLGKTQKRHVNKIRGIRDTAERDLCRAISDFIMGRLSHVRDGEYRVILAMLLNISRSDNVFSMEYRTCREILSPLGFRFG